MFRRCYEGEDELQKTLLKAPAEQSTALGHSSCRPALCCSTRSTSLPGCFGTVTGFVRDTTADAVVNVFNENVFRSSYTSPKDCPMGQGQK